MHVFDMTRRRSEHVCNPRTCETSHHACMHACIVTSTAGHRPHRRCQAPCCTAAPMLRTQRHTHTATPGMPQPGARPAAAHARQHMCVMTARLGHATATAARAAAASVRPQVASKMAAPVEPHVTGCSKLPSQPSAQAPKPQPMSVHVLGAFGRHGLKPMCVMIGRKWVRRHPLSSPATALPR
jgi:hypothetical protein